MGGRVDCSQPQYRAVRVHREKNTHISESLPDSVCHTSPEKYLLYYVAAEFGKR
jgi:hypothetical protein